MRAGRTGPPGAIRRALRLTLFVAGASACALPPAYGGEPAAAGEWWTPGFRARVAISACGTALCGHLLWVWDPRSAKPGREVLSGLQPDQNNGWSNGRAFNPDDGKQYAASIRLLDRDHLVVEGCLAVFCREQIWLRVGAPPVTPR